MFCNLIFLILPFCIFSCEMCKMYDEDLAKNSVLIAQQTYCPTTKIINDNSEINAVVHKDGEEAIVGFDKKYNSIFVGFKGSTNIINWLNNIRIVKTNPYDQYPEAAVEKGFYNMYRKLDSLIYPRIIDLSIRHNNSNIMVTGHSLGAALATLFTFDIMYDNVYEDFNIHSLITFGSPRVGNKQFSDLIKNITSFRVTHYYDMVAHIPFEFLDYLHISQEIWYNEPNTEYNHCDDEYYEDVSCCNSCDSFNCISIEDHLNYLNVTMGEDGC